MINCTIIAFLLGYSIYHVISAKGKVRVCYVCQGSVCALRVQVRGMVAIAIIGNIATSVERNNYSERDLYICIKAATGLAFFK